MGLLSISPFQSLSASFSSCGLSLGLSKPSHYSFSPQISIPSSCYPPRTSLRCALSSRQKPSRNLNFGPEFPEFQNDVVTIQSSSPQTPASAMRGAEADIMGLLLRERIVFLGSPIDEIVADAVVGQLLLLDAQDSTKDIRLFINSSGGSLSATMAIYDVVQLVKADVSTVALGIAASTASIILGAGAKGKRLAMPNARIMIHQPLGGTSGVALEVEIQAEELMHSKNNVTRIISGFTGRTFEEVEKDINRDRYMSPIEGVEYGIIDAVIDRDRIIPLVQFPEKARAHPVDFMELEELSYPDIPDEEIY